MVFGKKNDLIESLDRFEKRYPYFIDSDRLKWTKFCEKQGVPQEVQHLYRKWLLSQKDDQGNLLYTERDFPQRRGTYCAQGLIGFVVEKPRA